MNLGQLLDVLKQNLNLTLTIIDNGEQVITFNASGSIGVDVWLNIKEVERIGIESADHFNIYLKSST